MKQRTELCTSDAALIAVSRSLRDTEEKSIRTLCPLFFPPFMLAGQFLDWSLITIHHLPRKLAPILSPTPLHF